MGRQPAKTTLQDSTNTRGRHADTLSEAAKDQAKKLRDKLENELQETVDDIIEAVEELVQAAATKHNKPEQYFWSQLGYGADGGKQTRAISVYNAWVCAEMESMNKGEFTQL